MTIALTALAWLIAILVAAWVYWKYVEVFCAIPARADEIHTVTTPDLWKLKLHRYLPRKDRARKEPVLFVHGLGGNHFNFDAPEGESLVDTLAAKGYDCWVVDLRGTRSSTPPFGRRRTEPTVDDYLMQDLPATVKYIRETASFDKIHWVGHSLGGMLLYAYDAAHSSEHIASGTTLGSPTGFQGTAFKPPTMALHLQRYARPAVEFFTRAIMPFVPMLKPSTQWGPTNWRNMHPRVGAKVFYNLVEIPPPAVAEEICFWATHKTWHMHNDELDVAAHFYNLSVPLLAFYGTRDPFTSIEESRAIIESIPHDDKKVVILGKENGCEHEYNHVDMAFSINGIDEVHAPIAAWLAEHPIPGKLSTAAEQSAPPKRKRAPRKKAAAKSKAAPKKKETTKKKTAAKQKSAKKKVSTKKKPSAKRKTKD